MERPVRVLILSNYYCDYDDPWFRIRYMTANALSERCGMDVTLIAPSRDGCYSRRIHDNGLREIHTPALLPSGLRRGGFSAIDTLFKAWLVLTRGFDIIHTDLSHRPAAMVPAWLGQIFRGAIGVCELWEWFGRGGISDERVGGMQRIIATYDNLFEMPTLRRYRGVIAITRLLKDRFTDPQHRNNSIVLHGGAETEDLSNLGIAEARSALGLDERDVIVGMVSLCKEDEQDNDLFLDAFADIADRHGNLKLLVTGRQEYVANRFLPGFSRPDRVIYPGWVDRITYNKYLSACNFFVLPLRNNRRNAARWPNKIGDYFAVDRPVLTSSVGDLSEIIEQFGLGRICAGSSKEFAAATESWIAGEQSGAAGTGRQRDYARNELAFSVRVERVASFYRALLECEGELRKP